MDRKKRHEVAPAQYAYGAVETALAAVFGSNDKTPTGALLCRLKDLQRLGMGERAGKGARITYSREQAHQWLIALLMSEIGVDPVVTVELIKKHWPQLARYVGRATDFEA